MNVNLKNRGLVLTSLAVCAAAVGSASAAPPPSPEYGFRGLRRVELVFVNVGRSGMSGGVAGQKDAVPSQLPADDLVSRDPAKDTECQAIGTTLARAGLEVVEGCKQDDPACAQLYLTVENHSSDRVVDRIYLVGIELSQRVKLARDKKVVLSMPTTWSGHRVAVVAPDQSAATAACIDLRGLATWFGSLWKKGNK